MQNVFNIHFWNESANKYEQSLTKFPQLCTKKIKIIMKICTVMYSLDQIRYHPKMKKCSDQSIINNTYLKTSLNNHYTRSLTK